MWDDVVSVFFFVEIIYVSGCFKSFKAGMQRVQLIKTIFPPWFVNGCTSVVLLLAENILSLTFSYLLMLTDDIPLYWPLSDVSLSALDVGTVGIE